jgi:hypothetical protein
MKALLTSHKLHAAGTHVGVSYGMDGDNLPSPQDVVNLYNQYGIKKMRIYRPEPRALQALSGSDIELIVGILNDELQHFANSQADANAWVQNNILNYKNVKFRYIVVGNEADVNSSAAPYLVPAMMKFRDALKNAGLDNQIKISSAIRFSVLDKSYPPSAGSFRGDLTAFVDPLINFLVENNAPLMVNIYPYFAYADNPSSISIDYALFRSQSVVVQDGSNGYTNLFDVRRYPCISSQHDLGVKLSRLVLHDQYQTMRINPLSKRKLLLSVKEE